MSDTFLYKRNNEFVEVKKTGRLASKTTGARRQKEDTVFEIEPVFPDPDFGIWKAWCTEEQLFNIQEEIDDAE